MAFWEGSPSAIFAIPPLHCLRVIGRWDPGALEQVRDRCLGRLGNGVDWSWEAEGHFLGMPVPSVRLLLSL